MNTNLTNNTDDIITTLSKNNLELSENGENAVSVYERNEEPLILSKNYKTTYELYTDLKMKSPKKIGKNKVKKRKKHKKHKKHKNERNNCDLPINYLIDPNIINKLFSITRDNLIREKYNIPTSMKLNSPYDSAFFFGRTLYGDHIGKRQENDGHIVVIGGSGSGKTTGIAIPTTYTWKGTIFSFDFKGDLIKQTKRKNAKILYLLSKQINRYYYDPFYLLRQDGEENLVQNARELAQAIIPLPHDINDPFWIMSARDVLTGAIVYYFRLNINFIDAMIEIKTTKMSDLLSKICTDKMAAVCVNPDLDLNPKTLSGVSMELHNHISVFATDILIQDVLSPSEDASKNAIKWEDLERGDIFIRLDQSRLQQWQGVMRLMLIQLVRTLERRPEKYDPEGAKIPPTLLMLDEFPQYGKIDVITSALKILRSKNVTISLFCQSLADLDETYGKVARCAILDNCPYKAVLNASDAETQHYFSDLVGTVKVPSKGITANFDELGHPSGYSANINESREPIIYPHEFASLPDIVLLHPGPERFCRLEKETHFQKHSYHQLIEERN